MICGLSVPNFVSDETIGGWPEWAQRRITLAPELQGGTSVLLEVDRNSVRQYVLKKLFREVRDVLRDARIGLANRMPSATAALRSGRSQAISKPHLPSLVSCRRRSTASPPLK